MSNIVWKEICFKARRFMVSNHGKIKILARGEWKNVKLQIKGHGYLRLGVCFQKKKVTIYAHQLVAMAFIPNPECKPHINHINANPSDNRTSNLEWCTALENVRHAHVNNLVSPKLKMRSIRQLSLDGAHIRYWESLAAAMSLGFESGKIAACCKGKRKQHKGFKWQYADQSDAVDVPKVNNSTSKVKKLNENQILKYPGRE